MQIYGIYVLYCNIQIYLELNRCMIIYGGKYCCSFFVFLWTGDCSRGQMKKEMCWGDFRVAVMGRWPLHTGAR